MLNKFIKDHFNKALIIILSLLVSTSAFALDQDSSTTLDDIVDFIDGGIDGADYSKVPVPGVPDGLNTDFQRREYGGTGLEISASFSYGKHHDLPLQKYINTSGNQVVTVAEINAGIEGGISLGCDGLDLGLEALFDFDFGDILDYLPQYIMTQLATEALAYLYASPLIATVLDGIKAMRNASLEFNQASCDMTKVMDRAEEIKNERKQECIDSYTATGRPEGAAHAECSKPNELAARIKHFQQWAQNSQPVNASLSKILNKTFGEGTYSTDGSLMSKGRMLSLFIPDLQLNVNNHGSAGAEEAPEITPSDIYLVGHREANEVITNIYIDLMKSLDEQTPLPNIRSLFISKLDTYKDLLFKYGPIDAFDDDNALEPRRYTPTAQEAIKKQFAESSTVVGKTIQAEKGFIELNIAPHDGVKTNGSNITNDSTVLIGKAREMLTEITSKCWISEDIDGKNKWHVIDSTAEADVVLKIPNSSLNNINTLSRTISKCITLDNLNLVKLTDYISIDNTLYRYYLSYITKDTAYKTTSLLKKVIHNITMDVVTTSYQKLYDDCTERGSINMTPDAVLGNEAKVPGSNRYSDFSDDEKANCENYAKQNELTDEKKEYLKAQMDKLDTSLSNLKHEVEKSRQDLDQRHREIYK